MARSILPSGEDLNITPEEILRYLNADGIRQLLRQERLRWNLKPNKDADFYSNQTLFKYSGDLHNECVYQRVEIRTFSDNGAYEGYTGLNNDSGEFGIVHNLDKWDYAITPESLSQIVNRTQIGSMARIPSKIGYGLSDDDEMIKETNNRMSSILFDPFDGRAYLFTNDDPAYVNNENRSPETRLPLRTVARIGDIPTRITDLKNDLDFVSDPDYVHTDHNFTSSNKFILDNIDDRTFVYPEISKNERGEYIENYRMGLGGKPSYGESDGNHQYNSQPDLGENPDLGDYGDRLGEALNTYNYGRRYSGVNTHPPGYLPGVFRSLEELERVDLVDQLREPLVHSLTPGSRRSYNYYIFDGVWTPTWFDRYQYNDSYLAQSLHPTNMEIVLQNRQPIPYGQVSQEDERYHTSKLYQWRYNRITITYHSEDIVISIVEPGEEYRVGDILRWSFGDDVFLYRVLTVGANGQIQKGEYINENNKKIFKQDPSTHNVGLPFTNMSNVGFGARLSVYCPATITTNATQIKNNLYAYVDVVPTVRSDNYTIWSDIKPPDTQDGLVNVRSSASFPSYSGVNSGRGGPAPNPVLSKTRFHEHGGNATAGVQVHLFRYIINTQNPTWVIRDGMQVFMGRWVDQGPMGVERPCDIKALLYSNPDCNNFNNYYKWMLDIFLDTWNRIPDAVTTNNINATTWMRMHVAQRDPLPDQRFFEDRINPDTSRIESIDITDKVIYYNAATGVQFLYNTSGKNDPSFGYGYRPVGWFAMAGVVTR